MCTHGAVFCLRLLFGAGLKENQTDNHHYFLGSPYSKTPKHISNLYRVFWQFRVCVSYSDSRSANFPKAYSSGNP